MLWKHRFYHVLDIYVDNNESKQSSTLFHFEKSIKDAYFT